ncbi:MAG: hypothetical protein AAFV51_02845 [Pseudomonadota bacterium]
MFRALAAAFCAGCALAGAAFADQTDARLDLFFDELKTAEAPEAERLTGRIVDVWGEAQAPTAQLLFDRAAEAEFAREADLADELLTHLVGLYPSFAEGWAARGRVRLAAGDVSAAENDLGKALTLEPRHFPSLMLAAQIRLSVNDEEGALAAYLKALALNPHLENAKAAVRRLERRVSGQGI